MNEIEDLTKFSHSLHVMFVSCENCNTKHTLDLFSIFFSNIDTVDSKEDALKSFYGSKYDLIVVGLKIPKIEDGIKLIEEIRKVSKDITILAIASNLDQLQFTKLIELHIDGFIIKPIYIKQFSDIVHKSIKNLKNKKDIYHYRVDLEKKVKEQVEQLREKDKMLFQQSKLAAMGEMMDAVAHQWKQPINTVKMRVDILEYDFDDKLIDKEYILKLKQNVFEQFDHMTDTLNEFRNFFRPNKEEKEFDIQTMIQKTLLLVKDEFMKNKIHVTINEDQKISFLGVENEFIHLILNIINNAKDAFNERGIKDRQIIITLLENEVYKIIEIQDNAGGIPKNIIDDIFKANVTTKQEIGGTGIGLYMCSQIAQKYHGTLEVVNINDGAKFIFKSLKR